MFTRHLRALCAALFAVAALLGSAQFASAAGVQSATISQTQFDFGDIPLGSAKYEAFTLTSTGTAPLQPLTAFPGPNGYETLFWAEDSLAPLAPGDSRTYYVGADPWNVGPVDTTLTLDSGEWSTTIGVKYDAVPQPDLPYAHFDLRLTDAGFNAFLFNDIALQPTGGATGNAPGKFIFPISSGAVSPTNTGVLSSAGGLELRRGTNARLVNKLGVDLTRGRLTAILTGNRRVDIANLEWISDSWDIEGRPITSAIVTLNAGGAALFNAAGVSPAASVGDFIGSIEILKG